MQITFVTFQTVISTIHAKIFLVYFTYRYNISSPFKTNFPIKPKKECHHGTLCIILLFNLVYARSTAPERKHAVQTGIFFAPPATLTFTDLILGFHILLLLLCEWLTALPKWTPFPQTAHFAIESTSLIFPNSSYTIFLFFHNKYILSKYVSECKQNFTFFRKQIFPGKIYTGNSCDKCLHQTIQ